LKYLENIEENMGADDPAGLELLQEHLGPDLTELIWACTTVLTSTRSRLVWNPNASDSELVACLKDIIDAMATATGNTLNWTSKGSEPNEPRVVRRSSSMQLPRRAKSFLHEIPALHLVCDCDEAMADARVLQAEMAVRLGRLVTTDKPRLAAPRSNDGHLNYNGEAGRAEAIAVLLSKRVLHEPTALMEIYQAARQGKIIVPICMTGRGYDYKEASAHLGNLEAGLSVRKLTELKGRLEGLSNAPTQACRSVVGLQAVVLATLPRIIAVTWEPEGGKNQLEATVTNVLARLDLAKASSALVKPGSPMGGRSPSWANVSTGVTAMRVAIQLAKAAEAAQAGASPPGVVAATHHLPAHASWLERRRSSSASRLSSRRSSWEAKVTATSVSLATV